MRRSGQQAGASAFDPAQRQFCAHQSPGLARPSASDPWRMLASICARLTAPRIAEALAAAASKGSASSPSTLIIPSADARVRGSPAHRNERRRRCTRYSEPAAAASSAPSATIPRRLPAPMRLLRNGGARPVRVPAPLRRHLPPGPPRLHHSRPPRPLRLVRWRPHGPGSDCPGRLPHGLQDTRRPQLWRHRRTFPARHRTPCATLNARAHLGHDPRPASLQRPSTATALFPGLKPASAGPVHPCTHLPGPPSPPPPTSRFHASLLPQHKQCVLFRLGPCCPLARHVHTSALTSVQPAIRLTRCVPTHETADRSLS